MFVRHLFATTCLLAVLSATATGADDKPVVLTFDKASVGKVPSGWTVDRTGKGEGSAWQVVEDATAPSKSGYALAQTGESPGPMFNLCLSAKPSARDVEVQVQFKANKGLVDQGGGVIWRYVDANNYYTARYNPLEGNYRVYKVVEGKRTQLKTKEDIKLKAGEWHTLSIKMVGDKIACSLDGKLHLEATDATFTKAGPVGLWTKADARTSFDELKIQNLDK